MIDKKYIHHLNLDSNSLFLTDTMMTCRTIADAIEECDSKFFIINRGSVSNIDISSDIKTLLPSAIKDKVARHNIYCREITMSYHKTSVVLERFSVSINNSDPILFVFDYPFLYGSRTRNSAEIGDNVRLIHSHKYYKLGFDDMNRRIKSRSEFLHTEMGIKEIISRGRFVCGYQYTRTNKGKTDIEYRSIGEMWFMDRAYKKDI